MSDTDLLLDATLPHVPFDGWSDAALTAAAADLGWDAARIRTAAPRGAVDLAVAYHKAGDRAMLDRAAAADLSSMRYSERVAALIRFRLEGADREVVRRGTALFALPLHAATGAALIWGTADAIWGALGDTSRDGNWYTKRAILSGVYASTVLYWLGDQSGGAATDAFIDRRIADVMAFEKFKAAARENPVLSPFSRGIERLLSGLRAPPSASGQAPEAEDLPGRWTLPEPR